MRISLEWLRDYVDVPEQYSIQRVAHDLTMSTVEVEGAIELGRAFDHVVVGVVADLQPLAGHASRRLVRCDLGTRNVNVVSDAGSLAVGQRIVVALAGAEIRAAEPDAAAVRVSAREVDGSVSEGVICTAAQLGLAALFPGQKPSVPLLLDELDAAPGTALAVAIGWNDTILEIDNKSLTNRPDLWGHYGIARELAAIYRLPLRPLPVLAQDFAPLPLVEGPLDTSLCRRFTAAHIVLGPIAPSPFWMRSRLARVGQQTRNLPVDLTNYVMLSVGQPCHVYDARKLQLPLRVRHAQPGENILLLDGREYALQPSMPVVADGQRAVGAAGVMGSAPSAVDDTTTEIVLEMANFDALTVRRLATQLGLRTEASSRYEKALDTLRIDAARALFFDLLARTCPAARITGSADLHPQPTQALRIEVGIEFLQRRLGMPMERAEIRARLESVGFGVEDEANSLQVTVPPWRATGDVSLAQDVLEEIARLYGYENFRYAEPRVALRRVAMAQRKPLEQQLRELCARAGGLQEVVSYPWVADAALDATDLAAAVELELATPPAPDRRWLRPSLVPGIVERVAENLRYSSSFGLFEIGRVFPRGERASLSDARESLPWQPLRLAGAVVGAEAEALFVTAKGLIEEIGRQLGAPPLRFDRDARPPWGDANASVGIVCAGTPIGFLAVLSARTRRLAGIKRAVSVVFELFADALPATGQKTAGFRPLPEYPEVVIDISMIFPEQVAWTDIQGALGNLHPLIRATTFVDQFRGRGIGASHKSITLRLRLGCDDRTLRSEEVNEVSALAGETLQQRFAARARQSETEAAGRAAGTETD